MTTYQRLHKQLFLVRAGWFLTDSQLTLLLKEWPRISERVRDFLSVFWDKIAIGRPKSIWNRKKSMLIIGKNTQMSGYLPGLIYVKSTNEQLYCKAKNNSFAWKEIVVWESCCFSWQTIAAQPSVNFKKRKYKDMGHLIGNSLSIALRTDKSTGVTSSYSFFWVIYRLGIVIWPSNHMCTTKYCSMLYRCISCSK